MMLSSFPIRTPVEVAVSIHSTVVPYTLRQALINALPMGDHEQHFCSDDTYTNRSFEHKSLNPLRSEC